MIQVPVQNDSPYEPAFFDHKRSSLYIFEHLTKYGLSKSKKREQSIPF